MKKTLLIVISLIMSVVSFGQDKFVALSFDDGPNTTTTVQMLNVLKKHKVKGSFFVIGQNINEESAKVMKRAHKEGHDIENHSLTHSFMSSLSAESIKAEIAKTSALVEQYVGERPQFFRPPYINVNQTMFNQIPLPFICGEGCNDWEADVTVDQRVEKMLASARNGLIYLLHDFEGNDNTVKAVDRIIPILKKRGYKFVTVRELFKKCNVTPAKGILYTDILNAEPWKSLNINDFKWTREPASCKIKGDTIEVVTAQKTDLWQRTYYHFQNDNAPVFQMETAEKFFSFIVKTDFTESHHRFDQCGIVMYLDSENWLKGSVEYENEEFQHLGSVVTNNGYSDWATTAIPADVKQMWYRLSRREDDFCIECSTDGEHFTQMRVCHVYKATDKVKFGIYACSPEESSFKAIFTDMQLTECAWKAHDGQQADY